MDMDDEEIREGGLMPITIPLANPKLLSKHLDEVKRFASPEKSLQGKQDLSVYFNQGLVV